MKFGDKLVDFEDWCCFHGDILDRIQLKIGFRQLYLSKSYAMENVCISNIVKLLGCINYKHSIPLFLTRFWQNYNICQ